MVAGWKIRKQVRSAPGKFVAADVSPRLRGGYWLPLNHRRGPGEAGAENDHQDEVAALDAAGFDGFVQGDGDGGGGRVAVFVEVDEDLAGLGAEALAHGVDDALVGLVRDDALDLGNIQFAAAQGFEAGGLHGGDGVLEGLFAVHAEVMEFGFDGIDRGRTTTAATRHAQEFSLVAVRAHAGGEQAV